jgi:hypothetical protein
MIVVHDEPLDRGPAGWRPTYDGHAISYWTEAKVHVPRIAARVEDGNDRPGHGIVREYGL